MIEAENRIKPAPASDLRTVLGGVLFCVMGILALSAGARGIAVLFIGVGVIFGALVLSAYLDSRRALHTLRQSPMTSQATILDRQVKVEKDRYGGREWRTYWVVFRFDAIDGQVTLWARVPHSLYDRADPGTMVHVCYAAANPRIALLKGEDGYRQALEFAEGAQKPVYGGRGQAWEFTEGSRQPVYGEWDQATSDSEALPVGLPFSLQWMLASALGWAIDPAVPGAMGLRGTVVGAIVGVMQWLVLRRRTRQAGWWVLASAAGAGVAGLAVEELLIDTGALSRLWPLDLGTAAIGGAAGLAVGVAEWLVLRRWVRRAGWWVLASSVGMAIGYGATDAFTILPAFWASALSGAVCEAIRGLTLVWLMQTPVSE
jgi:hypothetical protein